MNTIEINLVCCGSCGEVFGHRLEQQRELTCPYCGMNSDICDFPDLWYPPERDNSIIEIT